VIIAQKALILSVLFKHVELRIVYERNMSRYGKLSMASSKNPADIEHIFRAHGMYNTQFCKVYELNKTTNWRSIFDSGI
jgi:hypothetical protein